MQMVRGHQPFNYVTEAASTSARAAGSRAICAVGVSSITYLPGWAASGGHWKVRSFEIKVAD